MGKYKAKKTEVYGILFDSKREAERYCELRLLQKAGKIKDLQMQVPFELVPAQYELGTEIKQTRSGLKARTVQRCVEKAVKYVADFVYTDAETGEKVVEDTKGVRTKDYIIKRKLMLYVHGIKIREI